MRPHNEVWYFFQVFSLIPMHLVVLYSFVNAPKYS